jgi:ribose transport system permease protein
MQSKGINKLKYINWEKYMVYIIFIVVFILFSIILKDNGFLSINNLLNILRQTAMISVMAVGGVFVMAAGQIDLTVGSIAAMSAMICALVIQATNSILLALITALIFGCLIGIISGVLVTKFKLPAFLATLGMMQVVRGIAMWITNTEAIPIGNTIYTRLFGIGMVGVIPVLILWTILFYIIGYFGFNKAKFGRYVLATGGNEKSASYSGVKVNIIKIKVFVISGILSAFAGVMYSARLQAGRYSYGTGDEMSVIAAVVLGGTSMSGGTGSIIGALFGSVLIGMINNALILAGLRTAQQTIIKGAIIILTVALSNVLQNKSDK